MTAPADDSAYHTVKAKLVDADRALQDTINWVDDAVGRVLAEIPEWGPYLDSLKEKFLNGARDAAAWLTKLSAEIGGDPAAIRQLGEDWVNQIGAVASAQAQALQRGQLPSFGKWKGNAADAYYVGAGLNQISALSAVKDATDRVNEAVNEVANAISSFWANILVALGAFIGALVLATVANATILGIPPGVVALILACVVFGAAVYAAVTSLGNTLDTVDRLFADATNTQPLAAGWPRLTSTDVLSDGSVRDGDQSEWQTTT